MYPTGLQDVQQIPVKRCARKTGIQSYLPNLRRKNSEHLDAATPFLVPIGVIPQELEECYLGHALLYVRLVAFQLQATV
jgi:hypothetical protein